MEINEDHKLLLSLIKPHAEIIRSKGKSSSVLKKKADAWKIVTELYNASSTDGPLLKDQLYKKWDNMVTRTKKKFIQFKQGT